MQETPEAANEDQAPKGEGQSTHWLRNYGFLVSIAGAIVMLDQWSKAAIRNNLAFGESWMPFEWLAPYLRLLHWGNEGSAFGLFQGGGDFFALLAVVVALLIVYYFPRIPANEWPLRIALGMQLGGALGNLIDRLSLGYVTDFISVSTFPVFNVADASITLGVVLLLLFTWFGEQESRAIQVGQERDAVAD